MEADRRIYKITDTAPNHEFGIYATSRCLIKMFEEFDISPQEILISDLKSEMKDFSEKEISTILNLLEARTQIKIIGDKIYRDTTVYSYKKTSE